MPLLGFKKVYEPLIISGKKKQTIRQTRKSPIKPGDKLFMYVGLRTKHCRKIGEAICSEIGKIQIQEMTAWVFTKTLGWQSIRLLDQFAQNDGFDNWKKMRDFFKKQYGFPFKGILIKWSDFSKNP